MASNDDRVLLLLESVRFILRDPERWTRRALARNRHGAECDPVDHAARSFSVVGALERALFEWGFRSDLISGAPARLLLNEAKSLLLPGVPWKELDEQIERAAASMHHSDLVGWLGRVCAGRARRAAAATEASR